MLILGFGCTAQVGKDTAADYLVKRFGGKAVRVGFADKVKETAQSLFGFSNDQVWGPASVKEAVDPRYNLSPREILQGIGQKLREVYPEVWVSVVFNVMVPQLEDLGYEILILSDVRYPNEADAIHENGGTVVRVLRDAGGTSVGSSHASETSMLDYQGFDYVLENNGSIEEYFQSIDKMMEEVLLNYGRETGRNINWV